jgi:hypothetical protein
MTAAAEDRLAAALAAVTALERASGGRPVRVILSIGPEPGAAAAVRTALERAGAIAEPLGDQPLMVAEGTPAQLRAAVQTGHVTAVQPDTPNPTN